jgi:hypothetical protein
MPTTYRRPLLLADPLVGEQLSFLVPQRRRLSILPTSGGFLAPAGLRDLLVEGEVR